MFESAVKF